MLVLNSKSLRGNLCRSLSQTRRAYHLAMLHYSCATNCLAQRQRSQRCLISRVHQGNGMPFTANCMLFLLLYLWQDAHMRHLYVPMRKYNFCRRTIVATDPLAQRRQNCTRNQSLMISARNINSFAFRIVGKERRGIVTKQSSARVDLLASSVVILVSRSNGHCSGHSKIISVVWRGHAWGRAHDSAACNCLLVTQ